MTIHQDWDKIEPRDLADLARGGWSWRAPAAEAPLPPMPWGKRLFDVAFALVLLVPLSIVMAVVALILLVAQGRPILYAAPRMASAERSFMHLKFRTMLPADNDSGVTGAHKQARITPLGHFLRRTRIDELPQLFNILRGDMSFVGPRPTIEQYVTASPVLYGQVLRCRPGITGLATLIYHRHEGWVLARCHSAAETEAAYTRRCLPTKLKIDLIYQRNRSLGLDIWIIWRTVLMVLSRDAKPRRRRGA